MLHVGQKCSEFRCVKVISNLGRRCLLGWVTAAVTRELENKWVVSW